MKVMPLNSKQKAKLVKWNLTDAYDKCVKFFEDNPRHPSLHYEVMRGTEHLNPILRSFRIKGQYRVEGYELGDEFNPIRVSKHYKK